VGKIPLVVVQAVQLLCVCIHHDDPAIQLTKGQTAAGVISLLNDFLISRSKPPLGFLNPWIYSVAATGFNDVTSGSNPGCGTSGFSAAEGWDPVGTMFNCDIHSLMAVLMDLGTGHWLWDAQLLEAARPCWIGLLIHKYLTLFFWNQYL
jgi:hypothetical protein